MRIESVLTNTEAVMHQLTQAFDNQITAEENMAPQGTAGQVLVSQGADKAPHFADAAGVAALRNMGIVVDGGVNAITTGEKGTVEMSFSGTIVSWTLLSDQVGDVVFDVWKDTFANAPPTVADTITGSAKPTLSGALSGRSTALTGWTTTVTQGDVVSFKVDSAATMTRVTLTLAIQPT